MLSLYALELGAQPLTIGMLAATFSIFPLLLAVQAGKLADRFGVRRLRLPSVLLGLYLPVYATAIGVELSGYNGPTWERMPRSTISAE